MNEKNNKNKVKISHVYVLKDGSTIKKEAIEKKKKRFKKLYIDTFKHEQDIRRWIEAGTRKKGDIKKSLEGLENKYQELKSLNNEFNKKGIFEIKQSDDIYKNSTYNLIQLGDSIKELYSLAGIERKKEKQINNRPSIYGKEIELVTDIPGNPEKFGLVTRKKSNISKKEKNKFSNFRKLSRRIAAFSMAMIMTIFAGAKVGDTKGYVQEKQRNTYTDKNREAEKQNFRETLYVEVAETIKQEAETITQEEIKPTEQLEQKQIKGETIKTNVAKNKKNKETIIEESDYYLAKEGTKYTEVSDGSGAVGYFSKDTKVKAYNRALVKTDKNGNKQIIEVTKIGQTWREYAEEKGLNYDEFKKYLDNNDNIEKCVSLESIDGEYDYGWVLEDTIEKIGEMER